MDGKALIMLAFQVSIIGTVFGFGLSTRIGDLLYLVRRPGLLVRSLVSVLVIMPVVAVVLVKLFDARQSAEIVLVALAISPVPPILPNRERKSGGRENYGLALMTVLSLLSIVTVPLTIRVIDGLFGQSLGIAPGAVAAIVVKMTLLPLAVGLAVNAAFPALAERVDGAVSVIVKVLLPLAALVLLAGTWRAIWDTVGGGTLVAMTGFVAVGLVVGHIMGGPDPENSVVLALSTACRHPMIAFSIAAANFPEQRFGASIIVYILVNLVVGAMYVAWHRRQGATVAPA